MVTFLVRIVLLNVAHHSDAPILNGLVNYLSMDIRSIQALQFELLNLVVRISYRGQEKTQLVGILKQI